jgi:hypothetical protein
MGEGLLYDTGINFIEYVHNQDIRKPNNMMFWEQGNRRNKVTVKPLRPMPL